MIRTFVFCDLETTGLITKTSMPKITELSLIAVSRNAICDTTNSLPRVSHKLILPINPGTHISRKIKELTGLSNDNLESVQPFNAETYNLISSFLRRLIAPVCFVAYNGNSFDYPIFLWEYKNINQVFDDSILSIDMLHLVRDFVSYKDSMEKELDSTELAACNLNDSTNISNLLNDDQDELLLQALDEFNKSSSDVSVISVSSNTLESNCSEEMRTINEKTPESQKIRIKSKCHKESPNAKTNTSRRKLNFTNDRLENFKLSTVYKYFCDELPANAHSAEGDCISMIHCAVKLGNFFVEWADNNAKPMIHLQNKFTTSSFVA